MITGVNSIKKETIANIKNYSTKDVDIFNEDKDVFEPSYSINFFPTGNVKRKLIDTVACFKTRYPHHSYMNPDKLHVTVIGRIPITIPIDKIVKFVEKNLTPDLRFKVEGVDLSEFSVAFLSFAQNVEISKIRAKFRNEISDKIKKYQGKYESIGWINFLRFGEKPTQEFYNFVLKNLEVNFGVAKGDIKILKNSSKTLNGARVLFKL